MIIGIGGSPGAGKESVARVFEKYGFEYCPRDNLKERKDVFDSNKNYVVIPITKKKDLEIFSNIPDFNFVFIHTDWRFRYRRWGTKIRKKPLKWVTYSQFINYEKFSKDFLNIAYSKEKYYSIKNDSSKENLEIKVLDILKKIKSREQ
jgi:hypothetical protein